jgi:hypothetical protein
MKADRQGGCLRFIVILGVFVSLAACAVRADREPAPPTEGQDIIRSIRYVKDRRTGLCFAYRWVRISHGPSLALTHVPCSTLSNVGELEEGP